MSYGNWIEMPVCQHAVPKKFPCELCDAARKMEMIDNLKHELASLKERLHKIESFLREYLKPASKDEMDKLKERLSDLEYKLYSSNHKENIQHANTRR